MTVVSDTVAPARRRARRPERSAVLDGVRGLAILLVVLSHSWKVWPEDRRGDLGSFAALFASGSVAVSIFFVITGFLVTRTFTARLDAVGPVGPLAWFTGRLLRISVQVWVLLAAVLLASRFDPTDVTPAAVTRESLVSAATYTWNTYVRDNALSARSDIGALYFLCIDVQVLSALLLAVLVLARARRVLTIGVLVLLVGSSVWRALSYQQDGWFHATLTTTTRMDAILWGVAAALLADRLVALRRDGDGLLGAATLVVLGCVASTAFWGLEAYFTVVGPVVGAGTALVVLADTTGRPRAGYADRLWSWRPFVVLGRASLTVFLWHIPIFEAVARHTPQWHPLPRTLVAAALLVVVVVVVERFVARPVTALVARLSAASARRPGRATAPTRESVSA
ncbi:acyltransferase family protein [Oryzobacter telluris]|uniref:acyltransferase family protein n=1 Tax=Oryzobacter telluris TaxID=3149179 RepID=UPI00370D44F8